MYRERRIGKFAIPWYASPKVQLGMVAFVCFLCPGMFNALGGMGGGGRADPTLGDNMVCLFSCFILDCGFGCGSVSWAVREIESRTSKTR